ncbi:SDR family oxidoreductase [Kibdelosporangium lantanae]
MSIVITGATGALGQLVIAELLKRGVKAGEITAVARSAEKAEALAEEGVHVRIADYDRPETYADVLRPEDRVLLISASEPGDRVRQHRTVIDAAAKVGVAQLAYTGVLGGPAADFLLADEHKATEQLILDTGLPYTFLRNGWYTENYLSNLAATVERGTVVNNVKEGSRIATAARADYAAAAAVVVSEDGHLNRAYELSGDTAWTFEEFAAELAKQSGRTVVHQSVSPAQHKATLVGVGLPEGFAEVLVDVDEAINRGLLAGTSGDLTKLIGRPTTPSPTPSPPRSDHSALTTGH